MKPAAPSADAANDHSIPGRPRQAGAVPAAASAKIATIRRRANLVARLGPYAVALAGHKEGADRARTIGLLTHPPPEYRLSPHSPLHFPSYTLPWKAISQVLCMSM